MQRSPPLAGPGLSGGRLLLRDVAGSPFTTLVLMTVEQGNLSLGDILPDESHARAVWTMEYVRHDQFSRLPRHHVVLNAIGDPDHIQASLPVLDGFCRQSERPVLNAPAQILGTARDRLGATLDGIEGVLTPRTLRCDFAALSGRTIADIRTEFGLELPLIIRPAGTTAERVWRRSTVTPSRWIPGAPGEHAPFQTSISPNTWTTDPRTVVSASTG